MPTQAKDPFEGYSELIYAQLVESDPISFKRMRRILHDLPPGVRDPFRQILLRLSGKALPEAEAREKWISILEHKGALERKLERTVGIQTAAVDFFDLIGNRNEYLRFKGISAKTTAIHRDELVREEMPDRVFPIGEAHDRLRDEMLRVKRYKHALSAVMIDIDGFRKIGERYSVKETDKVIAAVIKILLKTIRTVDIFAQCSSDRFIVILPNTNKREASELADRLCRNVRERTRKMIVGESAMTVTASVGQCAQDDSSAEFMKRLENALERRKREKPDTVLQIG